ncbi:hypothetical protein [Sulfobacillus harzensis]|uniref:Uncharacterized protein n=1 Tax=Sulfobacillus harzensis TaxID=2729629 RepID=A0A7Y0Q3Y5_9FIRM|nr:hypothetical protein [Sulfobacillus harzensis]NMP24047.1 hypothetical protein [Sulfobacillus harzensis]
MEDIIFLLLAALVLFLLLRNVLGGGNAGTSSAYQSNLIGSAQQAAQKAITAIDTTAANTASQLGKLAATVESNILHGAAKAYEKAPVATPKTTNYAKAVQGQLYPGIATGLGATAGPAGAIGAGVGSGLIDFVGGVEQGVGSAAGAVKKLPAQKWLNTHINHPVDHALGSAFSATAKFVSKQANNVTNWIGHVL